MYIQRHMGVLCHETGRCHNAVSVLQRSAATDRRRRSTNSQFRTLVLQAECLYHVGSIDELEALQAELAEVASRTSLGDWVARWECIDGHIRMDRWLEGSVSVTEVTGAYIAALVSGLGWSRDALDGVASRILWRVSLIPGGQADCARELIEHLRLAWHRSLSEGQIPSESHDAARRKVASRPAANAEFLLDQRPAAQVLATRSEPHAWEGL